ncbi:MAG TPA: tetratricopeptide repeat protein [Rhizobiaceae bacterium]
MTGWLAARIAPDFPGVRLFLAAAMLSLLFGAGLCAAQDAGNPTQQQIEALKSQVANGDAEALKQLEAMAESSPLAMATLGDMYSHGEGVPADPAKAAQYYESALAKGDKAVRTRLGLLYRDGAGLPANPSRALELLSGAAQEGDNWAMFHLAQGHLRSRFGSASRPAEGIKMLEQAMAAGNPQAAPALANLYMWGNGGVRRDPKRAVALLEEAADKGNAVAARNLIAIYRDGRGKLIAKDPKRAAALLDKYAALFDPASLATEKLLGDSVRTNTSASREALAESFDNADPAERRRLILSLRAGNPNAYVFLLQHRLKAAGKYNGNVDGRLNSTTIRAINSFCRSENISNDCRRGPLSVNAAAALADVLK